MDFKVLINEINGKLQMAKLGLVKVDEERARLNKNYSDILAEELKLHGEYRILKRLEAEEIAMKKEENKDKKSKGD